MIKIRKEKIKEHIQFFSFVFIVEVIIFLAIFIIMYLSLYYVGTFIPEKTTLTNATEILKAIITVNGVIIGFSGFIIASSLSSLNHTIYDLSKEIIEKATKIPKGNGVKLIHTDWTKEMQKIAYRVQRARKLLGIQAATVFLLMILSILSSFSSIAFLTPTTEKTFALNIIYLWPFTFLFAGIVVLLYTIFSSGAINIPKIEDSA